MSIVVDVLEIVPNAFRWVGRKVTGTSRTDAEAQEELRQKRRDKRYQRGWIRRQWKRMW